MSTKKRLVEGTSNFGKLDLADYYYALTDDAIGEENIEEVAEDYYSVLESVLNGNCLYDRMGWERGRNPDYLVAEYIFGDCESTSFDLMPGIEIKPTATLEFFIETGYYEGVRFDFRLKDGYEVFVNGYDDYDLETNIFVSADNSVDVAFKTIIGDIEYELDDEEIENFKEAVKRSAATFKKNWKKFENDLQKLIQKINKALAKAYPKYSVSARFSNGETWYSKVNESMSFKNLFIGS